MQPDVQARRREQKDCQFLRIICNIKRCATAFHTPPCGLNILLLDQILWSFFTALIKCFGRDRRLYSCDLMTSTFRAKNELENVLCQMRLIGYADKWEIMAILMKLTDFDARFDSAIVKRVWQKGN